MALSAIIVFSLAAGAVGGGTTWLLWSLVENVRAARRTVPCQDGGGPEDREAGQV